MNIRVSLPLSLGALTMVACGAEPPPDSPLAALESELRAVEGGELRPGAGGIGSPGGGVIAPPVVEAAPRPSAGCTNGLTAMDVEVGHGIPLPRTYSNPTGNRVSFIFTMRGNPLFGPAHEIGRVSLDAHTGSTSSSPPVYLTGLRTPVGTARVIIDVTTDRTGSEIVGQCDYHLRMKAPPGVVGKVPPARPFVIDALSYLFQVPVRMCVVEGSTLAGGKAAGETIAGRQLLDLLEAANREVWYPQAQVAFSSAIEVGFPVIADPSPPGPSACGGKGDLELGFLGGDAPFAETACAAAWQERHPGVVGIPVIFARDFCDSGLTKGVAMGPEPGLLIASRNPLHGKRGDDLCGMPMRLTTADITNSNRRPFAVMVEPERNGNARNVLAHELGHNLFLGHGNGLDDNHDGQPAGRRGPRRHDEYCDPAWLLPPENTVLAEDADVEFVDCETTGSLMQSSAGCSNLQPLQVESARSVARLMPGFRDTTPVPVLTQ